MADHLFMSEVTQPVLIKAGDLFLVGRADGAIPRAGENGEGLFFRDTRYLSCYALRLGGQVPMPLMASSLADRRAVLQLSNYDICEDDEQKLPLQSLQVDLRRTLDDETCELRDEIKVRSFAAERARFALALEFDAGFEDLFELRGAKANKRGEVTRTLTRAGLRFSYAGADGITRALDVGLDPPPSGLVAHDGRPAEAVYDLDLAPQASADLRVTFHLEEAETAQEEPPTPAAHPRSEALFGDPSPSSDSGSLEAVLRRSFADLRLLQTRREHRFITGGLPWFVAPFARDSLIAALQVLPYDPRPAAGVARQLAAHQGRRCDPQTREEPGKIPHELRVGEMARLKEIPHHPSYFSIDATPLFLALVGRHVAWTGRLELFDELRPNVERALAWLDAYGDTDGDGFVDYGGMGEDGPINQGWKDSADAIVHKDGRRAEPPIALCEVQGYVYLAKTLLAAAYRQAGDAATGERLSGEAADLARRFNRDFWMADEGCYSLALAKGGEPVGVVASNAGHALWAGIAEPHKARSTAARLLRPDMASGWGVRTLSNAAHAYNPLHYHLGSVWPFDNALLAQGLIRYGLQREAETVFRQVLDAAGCFSFGRLPEFYVGFQREPDLLPARCPFAEPLQAWSAGAVPAMTAAFLGLRRLCGQTLAVERPTLPPGAFRLALTLHTQDGDPIGCRVERSNTGKVTIRAEGPAGEVEIVEVASAADLPDWKGAA